MSRHSVACALIVLLAGCAAAPVPRDRPASGPAPANDNLDAVAWTQIAIEHDLIYRQTYRNAGEKLLQALGDPQWDALPRDEREGAIAELKPAVIVDVDETVLDNSPYQARLVRSGGEYDEAGWAEWCRERSARALPGALAFTRLAARHGVTVFYLSNRAQDLGGATLDNLRRDGFPLTAGEAVFLGLGTPVEGCEQVGSEKTCRRKLIGRNYRVLLQIGDQIGDFVGVPDRSPAGRRAALAGYESWIGERWFVLPNPTYGSWESALFSDGAAQTPDMRRRIKIDSLHY